MMKPVVSTILLIIIALWANRSVGQSLAPSGIRLARITFLTANLDSVTRSFVKKGYHIKLGKREPGGTFNNIIALQDGSEMILETTTSSDPIDWRQAALKKYGNHISGIAFEVNEIDSLYHALKLNNIPLSSLDSVMIATTTDSQYLSGLFALDSCAPLDVVFYSKNPSPYRHSPEIDSLTNHPNHVFRFDWMLLSASPVIEERFRKIFEIINARKLHQGCCDYWRLGPSDDFCFFRFEPPPKKTKGKTDWLSVEPDNLYFAY